MSNLTKSIFNSIDIERAKKIRLKNFKFLHKQLSRINNLKIKLDKKDIPMIYPYLVKNGDKLRAKLIKNKIYIAQYWSAINNNLLNNNEKKIIKNLVAIPIDQRYSLDDMKRIIEVIV